MTTFNTRSLVEFADEVVVFPDDTANSFTIQDAHRIEGAAWDLRAFKHAPPENCVMIPDQDVELTDNGTCKVTTNMGLEIELGFNKIEPMTAADFTKRIDDATAAMEVAVGCGCSDL